MHSLYRVNVPDAACMQQSCEHSLAVPKHKLPCRHAQSHQVPGRCRWAELQRLPSQQRGDPLSQPQAVTHQRHASELLIGQTRRHRTPLPLPIAASPLHAARPLRRDVRSPRRRHAPLPQQPAVPPLRALLPQQCAVLLRWRRHVPLPQQLVAPAPHAVPLRQRAGLQQPPVVYRRLSCAQLPLKPSAVAGCGLPSPAPTALSGVREGSGMGRILSQGEPRLDNGAMAGPGLGLKLAFMSARDLAAASAVALRSLSAASLAACNC